MASLGNGDGATGRSVSLLATAGSEFLLRTIPGSSLLKVWTCILWLLEHLEDSGVTSLMEVPCSSSRFAWLRRELDMFDVGWSSGVRICHMQLITVMVLHMASFFTYG